MGVSTERQLSRRGEDRRATLLRRAEALISERGYDNVRVVDIVRAAGVAKGLFYWYFESKELLLRELILDLRRQLQHLQAEVAAAYDDPLAKVYVASKASVEFVAEHFHIYGLFPRVAADPRFAPVLADSSRQHVDDAAALLRKGQRSGVVRTNDSAVNLAHGNTGIVTHFALLLHLGQADGAPSDVAAAAARYIIRGVAANESLAAATEARFHGGRPARSELRDWPQAVRDRRRR